MRARVPATFAIVASILFGCAAPPPTAYVGAHAAAQASIPVGRNAAGESCTQQSASGGAAFVYCGDWEQPSARILPGEPATAAGLTGIATASPWRSGLDERYDCGSPWTTTILGHDPAVTLACARKVGGWPQVAMVALVGGRTWLADGVQPAEPAMERAIGILSGTLAPAQAAAEGNAAGLAASRLAARAFKSGDIGQYENLMRAGARANQASNYEDAEAAYRAAVAVQEKVLGANNPNIATALMSEALQLSDQGRYREAAALFTRVQPLADATGQTDPAAAARLAHYRALDLLNQDDPAKALPLLEQAEAGYDSVLPPQLLNAAGANPQAVREGGDRGVSLLADRLENQELLSDPVTDASLYGTVETRRAEAVALRLLGRMKQSEAASASADSLARARGLASPLIRARLYRTSAIIAQSAGRSDDAIADLSDSSLDFARGLPGTKPYAITSLLLAGSLMKINKSGEALDRCTEARAVLSQTQTGTSSQLMQPCLLAYAAEAKRDPARAQAILADMFEAAQQIQGSVTSKQIAQATARLTENARDPKVAALIRARADSTTKLAALYQQRDDDQGASGSHKAPAAVVAALEKQIQATRTEQADDDAALQAASPNYGQLVETVVKARDVLAVLHPGEAFVATILTPSTGWTFLLREGRIEVTPIQGGSVMLGKLVDRIRAAMDVDDNGTPKPFDTKAASALYDAIFGGVADGMKGATELSVVPAGPLLSIPFGLLLTGPADPSDLAHAPWLIEKMTVAHVPAAANFVSLRRLAPSRAPKPWFGFGDFKPVTLAQAQASFPSAACHDSAQLLAGLPLLPGARTELEVARKVEMAGPDSELLGTAFNVPDVLHAPLKQYRILHFATHALLPTDIACQNEPAIVTSAPADAKDASGALLTSSDVAGMDLDADVIILSACNTGGPNGTAGESLSGLARSFFYAGARSLLVAHWAVNDRYAAYLVALTLAKARDAHGPSFASALAAAQRQIIAEAKGDLAMQAHPFYWAPLALIGEGSGGTPGKLASAQ